MTQPAARRFPIPPSRNGARVTSVRSSGPPETKRGGPQPKAKDRPNVEIAAKLTRSIAPPGEEAMSLSMLTHGTEDRRGSARGHRLPVAFASQAAPCAGRTQWHVMYACGSCGGTHFGRSPVELTTGKRLARCGRLVGLVISRTYRGRADSGAAA
jgi:hypothetical protein